MSSQLSISKILFSKRNLDSLIAVNMDSKKTLQDFHGDCRALIQKLKGSPAPEFILCCQNSYFFAVAFLSLLHSGKGVALPANANAGTIRDIPGDRQLIQDSYFDDLKPSSEAIPEIPEADCLISLFTSGSTGECQEITKRLSHLEAEIEVLEDTFAVSGPVIATISHQHIYGLLFKILWPLCSQRPFYMGTALYQNELSQIFTKYPESVLVSCPAHLESVVQFNDLQFLKHKIIFSSGAPLASTTASALLKTCKKSPIEVFGSTETGGIAWRQQKRSTEWTLFKSLQIKAVKGKLCLKSPFANSTAEWTTTSDKIDLVNDTTFKHLGRADRIVKVSGKRLSLTQLEEKISTSEFIHSAKVILLNEKGYTKRQSCATICILSAQGLNEIKKIGKRGLTQRLKIDLKDFFEAVVLPRFWRFVDNYPTNNQGKTTDSLLQVLFSGINETEVRFPLIKALSHTQTTAQVSLDIQADLSFFDGHFENQPILPGVAQVFIAEWLTDKIFDLNGVSTVKNLKFHKVILPDSKIELNLTLKKSQISFSLTAEQKTLSSGILCYD